MVVPDIQYPYHSESMLEKLLMVVEDLQPDRVIQIGDGPDLKEVSRWSVGTADMYKPTLGANVLGYRREVLVPLRKAAGNVCQIDWLEGNHDKRIMDFVRQYGWPLSTLKNWDDEAVTLDMNSMFGLVNLGINYVKGPKDLGNDALMLHGHELDGYASTPTAWETKFSKRFGAHKSVIFGHTHQPFLLTRGIGYGGDILNSFVMNVGSIMDFKKVDYVASGSFNWTHSFGVLRTEGDITLPELVTARNGRFFFDGYSY